MNQKKKKIILILTIGAVLAGFYLMPKEGNLFGVILNEFSEIKWDNVLQRNIVKNSIPIELVEVDGQSCKVNAKNFDLIIDHEYFVRGSELARELNYDINNETLTISCDLLEGEKSKLNVWYVLEESQKFSNRYQYFVTPIEDGNSLGI